MSCVKIRFTKREADEALNVLSKKGKQYRKEKRKYYCVSCNAWHLTSEEYRKEEPVSVRLTFKDKWNALLNNN